MDNIGSRIRDVRRLLKISQEQIAKEVNLTKQAISNVEHAKCAPNSALLTKLLVDYRVNLNYIFSGNGEIFLENGTQEKNFKNELLTEIENFLVMRGIS